MGDDSDMVPPLLAEIVADFQVCQGREKLEFLLEFSQRLPDLPDWLEERRDEMEQVHECMTPVFIYADHENDHLRYFFAAPAESPTVRGFAAILQQGTQGMTPEGILTIPNDFYLAMGLQSVLSAQRMNGMAAMLAYMKRLATDKLVQQTVAPEGDRLSS